MSQKKHFTVFDETDATTATCPVINFLISNTKFEITHQNV